MQQNACLVPDPPLEPRFHSCLDKMKVMRWTSRGSSDFLARSKRQRGKMAEVAPTTFSPHDVFSLSMGRARADSTAA